jgi:hypothetical protein
MIQTVLAGTPRRILTTADINETAASRPPAP